MIKAINTAAGLSAYLVIYYVQFDFELIQKCQESLKESKMTIDTGFYFNKKIKFTKGMDM